MIEIDCPLCGESQRTVLFPANFDTSRLDRQTFVVKGKARAAHYQINRCRHCGMVYSSPVMEHAALAGLYREFEHENTLQREIRNVAATSRHYYELARPYLSARGRALDVGCDIGLFLSTAQQDGFPSNRRRDTSKSIPGAA